jgi:hypothetical protein
VSSHKKHSHACKLLNRYLNWIRQNRVHKERVKNDINKKENDLRRSVGYEDVYEEDKEAIVLFRQVGELGEFEVEADDDEAISAKSTVHTNTDSTMEETDKKVSHPRQSPSVRSSIAGAGASSVSSTSLRSKFSSSQSLSPLEEADEESEVDDIENHDEYDRTENSSKKSEHADEAAADHQEDEISQLSISPPQKKRRKS